jgi:uracil-DNA glycosylase family 4
LTASSERQGELLALTETIAACRLCQSQGYLARANPVHPVQSADVRMLLVGQAPGAITDRLGYHFAGPAGRFLDQWFDRAGFPSNAFRERVYLTSLTRCFPGKAAAGKGDRAPSPPERALCRPYLDQELALLEPRLVILVGKLAIDTFLGPQSLAACVGQVFEVDGRRYLPLPHASGVSRWLNDPAHRVLLDQALAQLARLRVELELI